MYEEDSILAEQCARFSEGTAAAAEWLRRNEEKVQVRGLEGHERELRRAGRLFRSCARAASRKMCAGVFGPSQAGKSYLVSSLAGNAQGRLWTELGGTTYDFLAEINPAGGKESTGLVTRFTLERPVTPPDGFPVHVRLLSVTDVVKILANTYFSDAEHMDDPDPQAMLARLDELEKRRQQAATGGLDQDAMEDLQEYLYRYFRSKPREKMLRDYHFWDRAIPLAPFLQDADRATLFGLVWDSIPPFTALFQELLRALRSLDFSAEVFASINALIPREGSIIDVATLGHLQADDGDVLEVRTPGNKTCSLPRVFVTALTAELVIPMRDKPADFFAHTDLLDFPGYRSRKMFVNLALDVQEADKLKECFLRGKVAYLFQRYCAERELTSLLLCIGSGVQEVQGLGGAVNDWIAGTHGETPEARQGKDTALFFILTKGDMEFEEKAGAKDVSERWDIRLHASTELFSGAEWLKNWTPGRPFNNFFLMRNPTVKLHLFEHDADGRETALKADAKPYVGQFEQAFRKSPGIAAHFADTALAWNAFMAPGDGGLSLIRERLAPICKPELKREQIGTLLKASFPAVLKQITTYWRTDDKEELRKQKAKLGQDLARYILAMKDNHRFGQFMRSLVVRDQDIYDLYFRDQPQIRAELNAGANGDASDAGSPGGRAAGLPPAVDDLLGDLIGDDVLIKNESAPETADTPPDEARIFANHIENHWLQEQLRARAQDPVLQRHLGLPETPFSQLVEELSVGFRRLGARARMEDELRKASLYVNLKKEDAVWRQASLAAAALNSYVNWLGFDPKAQSDQERTVSFGSKSLVLFSPLPEVEGLPPVADEPRDCAKTAREDWAVGLIHLVAGNATFDGEQDFDPVENKKLGTLIDTFTLEGSAQ